jgi:hypothetical protein
MDTKCDFECTSELAWASISGAIKICRVECILMYLFTSIQNLVNERGHQTVYIYLNGRCILNRVKVHRGRGHGKRGCVKNAAAWRRSRGRFSVRTVHKFYSAQTIVQLHGVYFVRCSVFAFSCVFPIEFSYLLRRYIVCAYTQINASIRVNTR